MSDEHQARVWQAADKVRFFEVTEEPDAPQIHVVVSVDWEERAGVHVAEWDGGEMIRAFRHLRRAGEAVRDWANNHRITLAGQHAVDAAPFADCRPSNVPDPFAPGSTRLLRLPRASFWEVVTVPFDETGDTMTDLGERVSVVARRDYASGPNGFWTGSSAACVPLKAFADWDQARECAMQFERAAREWFNPFLIAEGTRGRRHPHRPEELMDALRLPAPRDGDWCGWWQEFVAPLPEDQRHFAWDQLGVRIYPVISVRFEAAV